MGTIRLFVDGSYCDGDLRDGKQQTHGGFVIMDNDGNPDTSVHVSTHISELCAMRNVGGELLASYSALLTIADSIINSGLVNEEISIHMIYDYRGIGNWLTGSWKAKKPGTRWYVNACNEILKTIPNATLQLTWVKSHSGNYGNSNADAIAGYTECYCNTNNIPIFRLDDKEAIGF